jgi:hypothetical protein
MHEGKQVGIVERGPRAQVVEGTSHARVCDFMLCTIVHQYITLVLGLVVINRAMATGVTTVVVFSSDVAGSYFSMC